MWIIETLFFLIILWPMYLYLKVSWKLLRKIYWLEVGDRNMLLVFSWGLILGGIIYRFSLISRIIS